MRKILIGLLAVLALLSVQLRAASPEPLPYDLLFKTGTLDDIPAQSALIYARDVINTLTPEAATRDTGQIELGLAGGDPPQASLKFTQGGKYRNLGQFPASVGNPIILYFVETVVRDMAESAGGSPFYIRNRVKESLVAPGMMEEGEIRYADEAVAGHTVTLSPFEGDPNSDRMKGFGALRLEITMSEAVPGWYHTLRAYVPGPEGDAPIYSSTLIYKDTRAIE